MRLYHSTDVATSILEPQLGDRRHNNEAEDAVGKPVVWLSSDPEIRTNGKGKRFRYRYTVDVPLDDPNLHEDTRHSDSYKKAAQLFGLSGESKWFYYTEPVAVAEAEEWDESEGRYKPIPLSALPEDSG